MAGSTCKGHIMKSYSNKKETKYDRTAQTKKFSLVSLLQSAVGLMPNTGNNILKHGSAPVPKIHAQNAFPD